MYTFFICQMIYVFHARYHTTTESNGNTVAGEQIERATMRRDDKELFCQNSSGIVLLSAFIQMLRCFFCVIHSIVFDTQLSHHFLCAFFLSNRSTSFFFSSDALKNETAHLNYLNFLYIFFEFSVFFSSIQFGTRLTQTTF